MPGPFRAGVQQTMRAFSALMRAGLRFTTEPLEQAYLQTEQRRCRKRALLLEALRCLAWATIAWAGRQGDCAGPLLVGALCSGAVLALHAAKRVALRCDPRHGAAAEDNGGWSGRRRRRYRQCEHQRLRLRQLTAAHNNTAPPSCCRTQYAAVVAANLLQATVALICCADALQAAPVPPAAAGTLAARLHAATLAAVGCGALQLVHLAWSHPLPFRCGGRWNGAQGVC